MTRNREQGLIRVLFIALLAGAGVLLLLFWTLRTGDRSSEVSPVHKNGKNTVPAIPAAPDSQEKAPRDRKTIALVIDDLGYQKDISSFLDLGIPLTFAVLPRERHTKDVVSQLTELRMPFLLHLPMEPEAYPKVDPGKAALLTAMSEEELRDKFLADLEDVPGAVGINNHMGSRFTADRGKMEIVLGLVKERSLFFYDSHTSTHTQSRKAARTVGLPFMENDLFLDLEDDPEFMRRQCDVLLRKAKRYGSVSAIGHIHKKHLAAVLKEFIPRAQKEGIEFVYVSDLVQEKAR